MSSQEGTRDLFLGNDRLMTLLVLNFTTVGIEPDQIYAQTNDAAHTTYYVVFAKGSNMMLGSFDVTNTNS